MVARSGNDDRVLVGGNQRPLAVQSAENVLGSGVESMPGGLESMVDATVGFSI